MDLLRHSGAALAALVATPLAAATLVLRPRWSAGFHERLGLVGRTEPDRLWVHAASLGEVRAAAGLVEELWARGEAVFGSSSTVAGREAIRRSWPQTPGALAPLDHPWSVEAALSRVAPRALVLVETELWPSWIAAAARRDTPIVVVSGRLSDRSFPRYWRMRSLLAPTFRRLLAVGARTPLDADRFTMLGVPADRVRLTGDLKLDPRKGALSQSGGLEDRLRDVSYFVAGSTHAGEEKAAIAALEHCESEGLSLALVLAPRYPERVEAVERQLKRSGRRVIRASSRGLSRVVAGDVLLLDTLGELPSLYSGARVAFVGGTISPLGGHNVMEPVQAGCPVLFGPHVQNVRRAVALLLESQAGECVPDGAALGRAVAEAVRNPEPARRRAARGRELLLEHRGSVERTVAMLDEVLGRSGLASSVRRPGEGSRLPGESP